MPIKISALALTVLMAILVPAVNGKTQTEDDNIPFGLKPKQLAERKEALSEGMAAANSKNWTTAREKLRRAVGIYPLYRIQAQYIDPRAFFNLALVNDRMGGHQFEAMGFYRAYLALQPNAKNANDIRKCAKELLVTAEKNMQELLKSVHQSALRFPIGSVKRQFSLVDIAAAARAFLGDIEGALKITGQLDKYFFRMTHEEMAKKLALAGNFKEAKAMLKRLPEPGKGELAPLDVWSEIGRLEAEVNDTKGALETLSEIRSLGTRTPPKLLRYEDSAIIAQISVCQSIIDKFIENENFQRAKIFLTQIRELEAGYPEEKDRYGRHWYFVKVLMNLGETEEAWKLAHSIPEDFAKDRGEAFETLGRQLVSIGETEKMRQTLKWIVEGYEIEYLTAKIEEVKKYKNRINNAKTDQERLIAQTKLQDITRPPGPFRFDFTHQGRQILKKKITPAQIIADEWASFASLSEGRQATNDFKVFLKKLKSMPEFVMSTATGGISDMIKKLKDYRKIEFKQQLGQRLISSK